MKMASHLRLVGGVGQGPDRLAAFLLALAALSESHGIVIADGAQLYEMDRDDHLFSYQADDDSRLVRA
jgi:hypothetical protein